MMNVSLKFIIAFFLLMLSFSMSGNASNCEACFNTCECSQLSEAIDDDNATLTSCSLDYNKSNGQITSDMELGLRIIETSSSSNNRLRRLIEINDSLRSFMRKFLMLRENSLVLDQSKSYCSAKEARYFIISNDYYIYALRRIQI